MANPAVRPYSKLAIRAMRRLLTISYSPATHLRLHLSKCFPG
jgi:hypothetical protein